MGAVAAPVAAVSSLASIGMSFASASQKFDAADKQQEAAGYQATGIQMQASGTKSADEFQAARADEAAKFGRLQADLTGTTLTEQLNTTLSNIDALRAGGNIDPSSPTGAAIADRNAMLSDRQRIAQLVTLRSQAASDDASAAYLRKAGEYALLTGDVGAKAAIRGGEAAASATRASGYADIASGLGSGAKGAFSLAG